MKINKCPICTTTIDEKRKTCSRICADKLKKIESRENRNCLECNIEFSIRKKDNRKICSDKCRKIWNAKPENKSLRLKSSEDAVIKKHGVKSTLMLKDVKVKIQNTKLEKYGNENYNNYEKSKITNKERYNVEHGLQFSEIRNKGKITRKEIYNDENFNNRQKAIDTSIEKFGATHAIKLDEYKEKQKQTNLNKYGVNNPMQNPEVKQQAKNTNLQKYGYEHASQSEEVKQKIKNYYFDKFPEGLLMSKTKKNNLTILDNYSGARCKTTNTYNIYNFQCNECKTIFTGTFSNHRAPVCRVCYPIYKNNKIQQELRAFLIEIGLHNKFDENKKNIINPYELDFYLPEKNLAIEINGNYFHSEIGGDKDKNYHLKKTNMCFNKHIRLIHVFEDEWIFNKEIIKSKLKNILNIPSHNIYARKCNIQHVPLNDKIIFLDENHLQGNAIDTVRLGLYQDDVLVSIMTFIKLRYWMGSENKIDNSWELSRFCSKINSNVIGGFSKLLSNFIKTFNPSFILTFADCRWSDLNPINTVYCKNGFEFKKQTPPSYWYFKKNDYLKRFHRYTFNKKVLLKICDLDIKNIENITEWELAQSLKMDRIWDCGNMRFEMKIKKEL